MDPVLFIAQTSPATQTPETACNPLLMLVGIYFVRFLLLTFALYLASQTITNIPMLQKFMIRPIGQLVIFILILAAAGSIAFWLKPIRLLHASGIAPERESFVWPDILLTALVLTRASHIWHYLFRWLDRKSSI